MLVMEEAMRLIDLRTTDGSRHFASLPRPADWSAMRDHVRGLSGAKTLCYFSEDRKSPRMDFSFRRHYFLIAPRGDSIELFVQDPQCPDLILYEVGRHFEQMGAVADSESPGIGQSDQLRNQAPRGPGAMA